MAIRDFVAVVAAVKAEIPVTWPEGRKLKIKLTELQVLAERRSDADGHEALFEMAAGFLAEHIGELDCQWKKRAYAVWRVRR